MLTLKINTFTIILAVCVCNVYDPLQVMTKPYWPLAAPCHYLLK